MATMPMPMRTTLVSLLRLTLTLILVLLLVTENVMGGVAAGVAIFFLALDLMPWQLCMLGRRTWTQEVLEVFAGEIHLDGVDLFFLNGFRNESPKKKTQY